jgi:hypothetical protein
VHDTHNGSMSETARYASHDSLNSLGFLSDTLWLFGTVDVIDLPHNQSSPLHGSGNHLVSPLWPAEEIVSHVHVDFLSSVAGNLTPCQMKKLARKGRLTLSPNIERR